MPLPDLPEGSRPRGRRVACEPGDVREIVRLLREAGLPASEALDGVRVFASEDHIETDDRPLTPLSSLPPTSRPPRSDLTAWLRRN